MTSSRELCDTRTYAHREGLRTFPGETLRSREENILGCARENTPFTNGQQLGAEILGRPSISIIRARNSQIYAAQDPAMPDVTRRLALAAVA
jgi:hypothetical protein